MYNALLMIIGALACGLSVMFWLAEKISEANDRRYRRKKVKKA